MVEPIKQNKSKAPHCPSCPKTAKGSLQNVSWSCFHPSKVKLAFKLLPSNYSDTLEDS